jgi:hypothetical protein
MPTSKHWFNKALQTISTNSNRRHFLKATIAAGFSLSLLGVNGALYGCASRTKPQLKDTMEEEIKDLMWGPTTPERVDRLVQIMDQAMAKKDAELAQRASEGLVPHAGQASPKLLIQAYNTFPEEEKFQRYLIQLLALNFIVNAKERKTILSFYWTKMSAPRKDYNTMIAREIYSDHVRILGLMGIRQLRRFQRLVRRSSNIMGYELVHEYHAGYMLWQLIASVNDLFSIPAEKGAYFTFKDRFSDPDIFNAVHVAYMKRLAGLTNINSITRGQPPGKSPEDIERDKVEYAYDETNKAKWRGVLKDWWEKLGQWQPDYKNEDPEKRIFALLSLDEGSIDGRIDQDDCDLVRELSNIILSQGFERHEVKRVALSIIGSYPELSPDEQNMLVKHLLENTENDLVLSAARGLRFRNNLPAEKILYFLSEKKKEDAQLGQYLEDLLLSSLNSQDAFRELVNSLVMTHPKDIKNIRRRAEELRIWYLGLGGNRDQIVRQGTSLLAKKTQDSIIEWLRNISMMHIWVPMPTAMFLFYPATQDGRMFTDQEEEAAIDADSMKFAQIVR